MKKDFESFATVFIILFAIIALFWVTDISFHLMSSRSTFENTFGLVIIVLIVAVLIIFLIKKIKFK
jgi:type IV secretory pathway component VirB8